jgi:hypothetical protein
MENKQRTDPNAVVVTMVYYADGRHGATGTISFRGARRDIKVLEAQAEMVDGVASVTSGFRVPGQELEIRVTDYHSQTKEMAAQILHVVLRKLGLTIIGRKIKLTIEPEPKLKKGKKKRKK